MCSRGFEVIEEYKDKGINLPVRKTKFSAGYDVEAAEDVVIPVYTFGMKPTLIPTGLKAYCKEDEFYILVNRSSGPKKGDIIGQVIFQKYLTTDADHAEGIRSGGFGSTD